MSELEITEALSRMRKITSQLERLEYPPPRRLLGAALGDIVPS